MPVTAIKETAHDPEVIEAHISDLQDREDGD